MVTTTFANLQDGFQFLSLFDQAFAQCAQYQNPIIVMTAGGTFTATGPDILIIGSGANSVQLRDSTTVLSLGVHNNQPQSVVDIAGNAAANQITILPFGSQKIMGQSSYVIGTNYGGITFWPIASGGWYLK